MCTQPNVIEALREAEAALELAIRRILKRDPDHYVEVTSEAKALVSVRQALQGCASEAQSPESKQPQKFTGDSEMRRAFEIEYGQNWTDPDWRRETGIWAYAWHKATAAAQQGAQQSIEQDVRAIVDLLKNREWAEHIGQTELGRELEYEITKLYNATHPTTQGLEQDAARYRWLRATTNTVTNGDGERIDIRNQPELWDKAIDAAIAAQATQGLEQDEQRQLEIGSAIERACIDLPIGTELIVSLEKGAGTVTLFDSNGNEFDHFQEDHETFAERIHAAIDGAIAAEQVAAQAKQGGV